jgi:DNA processing protein
LEIREKLIHLHHCQGVGWKSIHKILTADPALYNLYNWTEEIWRQILPLPSQKLHQFLKDLHNLDIKAIQRQYSNNQIECMTIIDEDYPFLLKHIFDPPWVMYLKGNRRLIAETPALGVVGSRRPSLYGKTAIKSILPSVVKQGYVIVSGLATGIDSYAHKIALIGKGKTIGVLGGGLFHIYPKENLQLASAIIKHGLLISETPPGRRPEPWMFPLRNRIISGLSSGIFIIEAKQNSGSLITAQYALDHGRDVFALPGNIDNELSTGSNKMIQDGAKLVLDSGDIINELFSISK